MDRAQAMALCTPGGFATASAFASTSTSTHRPSSSLTNPKRIGVASPVVRSAGRRPDAPPTRTGSRPCVPPLPRLQRLGYTPTVGTPGYDSSNTAPYYPWLEVANPLTGRPLLVPPSGHVAGVWCRTDAGYGVHRAPTEGVLGVAGLDFDTAENDQAELAEAGVNSMRAFPGHGIRVWGARTLSSDPEWRYVPVRRVFLHLAVGGAARTGGALSRPQLARRRAGWRNRQ
jgi:hypothetical protein